MARPRLILITFDVDGTLIRSLGDRANHLHKRAFAHAFLEIFGVNGHCDVLPVGILSLNARAFRRLGFCLGLFNCLECSVTGRQIR
jgi:hypothetical protein